MRINSLVTGANRGIGLALVQHLLERGDHVTATCRQPGKANALNTFAGEFPGRLHVLPLDVANQKSRLELVRELPLVLGDDGRIDLLINNAGVLHPGERFGHVQAEHLEDSFRVNAIGPFLFTQSLAPLLADGARIANLSSVMGSISRCGEFRSPSYCSSKAAQNMLNVELAHALRARGIVVLALHPGWVQTEMGGSSATVAVGDSARGLLKVIDASTSDDSGHFLDWSGKSLPW